MLFYVCAFKVKLILKLWLQNFPNVNFFFSKSILFFLQFSYLLCIIMYSQNRFITLKSIIIFNTYFYFQNLNTDFDNMSMSENMKQAGSSSRRKKSIRKSRKGKQRKAKQLSNEDLEFLKKNTKYDEAEIREWYKGFKVKKKLFWQNISN